MADLNTARYALGGAGGPSSALGFGGKAPETAATESWNGSSWTEVNDLSTARRAMGYSSSQSATAAFAAGGTPPNLAVTEEFTADATLSTVTVS